MSTCKTLIATLGLAGCRSPLEQDEADEGPQYPGIPQLVEQGDHGREPESRW